MSDEQPSLMPAIATILGGTPASVKTPFFKTLGSLLGGLTAIPAGWARRPGQAIEDKTAARSSVSAAIAQAVAQQAIGDPVAMQAAAEMYLPVELRKARNKLLIAQSAAEHVADDQTQTATADVPQDDWMNTFMRFAEDASSERLQDLFGRILAGQVSRPGSFATATLRTVSEIDQSIAQDFSMVWQRSVGLAVDHSAEYHRGAGFARWKRLAEAGLMAQSEIAQFTPPYAEVANGASLWTPMVAQGIFVVVFFQENSSATWRNIEFTRAGREIGSLLPPPDYLTNMRSAAAHIGRDGISRIQLHAPGQTPEVLLENGEWKTGVEITLE